MHFFLFSKKYYPHKSRTIFHIDLYILSMYMEVPNGTNELYHVKRLVIFQNKPFWIPYSRMNHLCHVWNKRMLTIVQNTLCNRHAQWLPLVDEKFVIDKLVAISIIFFGLGVTKDAAKPDCIHPTGDDGSLYEGHSSVKLIFIESMKHCSQGSSNHFKNANTGNHTLISQTQIQRKFLLGFLY
jgi:hypothetical protein